VNDPSDASPTTFFDKEVETENDDWSHSTNFASEIMKHVRNHRNNNPREEKCTMELTIGESERTRGETHQTRGETRAFPSS
jgi:hypothetical protein